MTAISDLRRGWDEAGAGEGPGRPEALGELAGRIVLPVLLGAFVVRNETVPPGELGPLLVAAVQLLGPVLVLTLRRTARPALWQKELALGLAVTGATACVLAGYHPTFAVGTVLSCSIQLLGRQDEGEGWHKAVGLALAAAAVVAVPVITGTHVTFFDSGVDDILPAGINDLSQAAVIVALLHSLFAMTQLQERARVRAEAAVVEERARIARELHDVIAHQVTLGLVQAEVARATLPEGADAAALALDRVTESSRRAMTELRALLGVLRDPDGTQERAPQPGVAALHALVAGSRPASLDVDLTIDPAAEQLPDGVQTSIYRLVQEALTNVVRHVGPTAVRIDVRCADTVEVSVVDAGPTNGSRPTPSAGGGGHGLAGMRERVASLGGTLEAGPDGRGFAVRASIPRPS